MKVKARKGMIDRAHTLPVIKQCQLVGVSRSSIYYQPVLISDADQKRMRLIDEIHMKRPFLGARRIRDELIDQGHPVNRKKVQRLMRKMGIIALYPKPVTSRPGDGHRVYPYLLRGMAITRPNQVWAADISVPQQRFRRLVMS